MREVLAPALAMFAGEACGSEEHPPSHRLPEFSSETGSRLRDPERQNRRVAKPFLTPEAIRLAEETARTLNPAKKRNAFRWIMVAAVCLMTSFGVLFAVDSMESETQGPSDPVMLADKCLWTEQNAAPSPGPSEPASSRWVVLSCVACHLEDSLD
jgi:hypothetical protein